MGGAEGRGEVAPLGHGLHAIVLQLIGWAADHHDEIRADRAHVGTVSSRGQAPGRSSQDSGANSAAVRVWATHCSVSAALQPRSIMRER